MEGTTSNLPDFDPSHVTQMEEAANILMSPNISHDARKAAEEFFINIRNERFPPEYCRSVIEATSNEFVIFEMVQLMTINLLKQWSILESRIIQECFNYFLENALRKFRSSKLIRTEMLRGCSKLIKRSIFDNKACDDVTLDQTVHFLLTNEDPQTQAFTCEFIESVVSEFATSWRMSNLGISFDFHSKAKRSFENGSLQRLFEKCIRTFPEILFAADLSSPYFVSLYENFLRIADLVLSWNFENFRLPIRITFPSEGTPAAILRPPESWKRIFQSGEFLPLFFELHKRVRHNEILSVHSLNCLIQLSSLMGPVLIDDESVEVLTDGESVQKPSTSSFVSAHDRYVSNFIDGFVDIFKSGPLENEVVGLCLIVYKILTYHRIHSLPRAGMSFVSIIIQCFELLTPIAMQKALGEDDHVYLDSLQNLYDGWWVLLRNSVIIQVSCPYSIGFEESTLRIISAFMRTVLSEPHGSRVKIPFQECDEGMDDRELFKDLLDSVGRFSAFYSFQMLPRMSSVFLEKLRLFLSFIEMGVNDETLNVWREDMHWILLLTGFILTTSDDDGGSHFQSDVVDHFEHNLDGGIVDIDSSAPYIKACIDLPHTISEPERVDPLIKLIGAVLAWCSIEHKILMDRGAASLSPELARSSLLCMRRLICAAGIHIMNPDNSELASVLRDVLQTIVDFALQKSFCILNNLSGEEKLCVDAVEVFVSLVRIGCNEAAKSPYLFPCLRRIKIELLPARHSFLKVLVEIGVKVNDENIRKTLNEMILEPLRERFMMLSKEKTSLETDLVDLLDCFGGVADAAQSFNTHFLYEYLSPILTCSIVLLSSRNESLLITNAVLSLFDGVMKRLGLYSGDYNDMAFLYEAVLELIKVYRDGQFTRYRVIDVDVEEKASDLIVLLDILGSILSKDFLASFSSSSSDTVDIGKCGSRVAFIALEMLLPIMEDDLLKLPSLCRKFYRFILHFTEVAPHALENLPEPLFISIIECVRHGLNSDFGQEILLISAETVTEVASYFTRYSPKNEAAIARLAVLIEPTFGMCLSCWQVELHNASVVALFSLICCNRVAFEEYVKQLLSRNENRPYLTTLQSAFEGLLPGDLELRLGQRGKVTFRNRLEQFLNRTQGLLVVE